MSIQAIKQWCTLHKSDKHSFANCRTQQDTASSSTKKPPTIAKKGSKPRRLRFKTAGDRKKFLRSVGGLEGVSLEDSSDDENVVEQSLMQLQTETAAKETEDDIDDTLVGLHVLVLQPISPEDTDVIMRDELLSTNQSLDPFGSNTQPTSVAAASNLHLEGEPSLHDVIEQTKNDFAASQSQTLNQDRSPSTIPVLHPQFEEGPPTIKEEMSSETFPPLPSPELPVMTTAPLPHGPVLINNIYYQPVPVPHNVVVTQSTVPAPTIVPCVPEPAVPCVPEPAPAWAVTEEQPAVSEKPKVGLEFAMPETPSLKKSISNIRLTDCSRSNSRQREERKSPKASPEKAKSEVRPTARGHRKKKPEMTNAPILVSTTHSHLISTAKHKPGLTVNFSAYNSIPRTVQHLSQLTMEVVTPLDTNSRPSAETSVTLEPTPIHDDSDVDLETGEVRVPTKALTHPHKFRYKLKPNSDDYEVQAITSREAPLWD